MGLFSILAFFMRIRHITTICAYVRGTYVYVNVVTSCDLKNVDFVNASRMTLSLSKYCFCKCKKDFNTLYPRQKHRYLKLTAVLGDFVMKFSNTAMTCSLVLVVLKSLD